MVQEEGKLEQKNWTQIRRENFQNAQIELQKLSTKLSSLKSKFTSSFEHHH